MDTKETVSAPAFSGDSTHEPIPDGTYEVLEKAHSEWFRIDPQDKKPRNDIHDATGRCYFRLHYGGVSYGCITVTDEDKYKEMRRMIVNTKTEVVPDMATPWYWRNRLVKYGTMRVKK